MKGSKYFSSLRRLSYFLTLAVILALFFSYYLFVFVAGKEKKIIDRNFRVLNKIGENLQSRINDNYKIADRLFNHRDFIPRDYGFSEIKIYPDFNGADSIKLQSTYPAGLIFIEKDSTDSQSSESPRRFFRDIPIYTFKPFDKIFSELRRNDIFKYHMVISDSNKIIYSDFNLINPLNELDTSFSKGMDKFNSRKEVEISGETFYLFSHSFIVCGRSLTVIGIVPEGDYATEKNSVPESFILSLVLTVFLILIFFPFLKSLLISPRETLSSLDLLGTLPSLFLIFCVYTFLQLHLYARIGPDSKKNYSMLDTLADIMAENFQQELESLYKQAYSYDSISSRDSIWRVDYYDLNHKPRNNSGLENHDLKSTFNSNFKYIFWLDSAGGEKFKWTTDGKPIPREKPLNLNDREYFKAIVNKKYWYLSGDSSQKFCFEPVYSWRDGSYRAVLSLPGKKPGNTPVVVIASELKSVQKVLLPEQLNYCIIDDKGKVLFHSEEKRNSNENLLEECNNEQLSAAILARSCTDFSGYYMDKNYDFYIKPVPDLPLFVITFSDSQYVSNINLQVFLLTFTHALLMLLLIIVILAIYIFFLRERKKFTKQRVISFEELYPTLKNEKKDTQLIIFNGCLIIISLVLIRFIYVSPLSVIFLFITNTVCSTSFFIFLRTNFKAFRKKIIIAGHIFLFVLLDISLLIEILPGFFSGQALIFYVSLIIQTVLMFILIRHFKKGKRYQANTLSKKHGFKWYFVQGPFYRKYAVMLFSCFLLTGAVPTLGLYKLFYNEEYGLLIKYMQLQIAKNAFEKSRNIDISKKLNYLSVYFETKIDSFRQVPETSYNNELIMFRKYLNDLRLKINPYNKKVTRLSLPRERDGSVFFTRLHGILSLYYTNLSGGSSLESNKLLLQSQIPRYLKAGFSFQSALFFTAGMILFFAGAYLFILFFVKRFFLFRFFPDENISNASKKLSKIIEEKFSSGLTIRQIIVGVPRSGKNDAVADAIGKLNKVAVKGQVPADSSEKDFMASHFVKIDLSLLSDPDFNPQIDDARNKFFLLQHFDFDLSSAEVNKRKLNLIKSLVQDKSSHVIISTSVHPSIFLKSLKNSKSIFETEDYINNTEYFNWSMTLSGFDIFIYPIIWPPKHIVHEFKNEVEIYKAHRTLYQYFYALWGSLSKDEKFVLFDLAEDNIANYQNRDAILSLYYKGIIVFEGEPRLIHESLRDFILSEVKDIEVYKEKVEAQMESSWGKFRLPFLAIVVIILFFVFYTQKETFNKVLAIITAFAAAIPTLTKLLGSSITKGKEGSSA